MRKLALSLGLVATLLVAAVAYAQQRCGSNLCMGSSSTAVNVKGALNVDGASALTGAVTIAATATKTSCTLDGASPAVCTATVTASSKCFCSLVGGTAAIAAMNCAVDISGTTATVTAANAANAVVNILCL